jgi:hypothetical protein
MRSFFIALISLFALGCAQSGGTSTGNPLVDLKFDAFNASLAMKKATATDIGALSVSSLKFCFKRLRFKQSGDSTNPDPTQDSDNQDFYLGEVTISSLGTNLSGVTLPAGTYERIEFDLEDSCPSGHSVELTNGNGTFTTSDSITIRFDGSFTQTGADTTLGMDIQAIVSALNTVSNSSQIKNKAEGVDGSF